MIKLVKTITIDELPKDKINYTSEGRVRSVEHFCLVNGYAIATSTYSRRKEQGQNMYFSRHLDKHQCIATKDTPTAFANLPGNIQKIFLAETRNGVEALVTSGELPPNKYEN